MSIEFDAHEVVQFSHQLQESTQQVRRRASQIVRATGARVERDAKAGAPVDTGYLRSSITTSNTGGGDTTSAEVSVGANYGIYQEFGTSRMAPHPFLIPAFDRNKPAFLQAMERLANGIGQ